MSRLSRNFALVLLVIVFLLALPAFAIAQDEATPTAEPTVTIEPTPIPEPEPTPAPVIDDEVNFSLGVWGFVAGVVSLLIGGGGIGYVLGHVKASKEQKDNLERAYESTSPATQEQIRKIYEQTQTAWDRVDTLAREVLKFVGEVTDKLPNPPTPPTA